MRELIDRQTAIEEYCKADCGVGAKSCRERSCFEIKFLMSLPTVTRISDERYQRLIGKKVKA